MIGQLNLKGNICSTQQQALESAAAISLTYLVSLHFDLVLFFNLLIEHPTHTKKLIIEIVRVSVITFTSEKSCK